MYFTYYIFILEVKDLKDPAERETTRKGIFVSFETEMCSCWKYLSHQEESKHCDFLIMAKHRAVHVKS